MAAAPMDVDSTATVPLVIPDGMELSDVERAYWDKYVKWKNGEIPDPFVGTQMGLVNNILRRIREWGKEPPPKETGKRGTAERPASSAKGSPTKKAKKAKKKKGNFLESVFDEGSDDETEKKADDDGDIDMRDAGDSKDEKRRDEPSASKEKAKTKGKKKKGKDQQKGEEIEWDPKWAPFHAIQPKPDSASGSVHSNPFFHPAIINRLGIRNPDRSSHENDAVDPLTRDLALECAQDARKRPIPPVYLDPYSYVWFPNEAKSLDDREFDRHPIGKGGQPSLAVPTLANTLPMSTILRLSTDKSGIRSYSGFMQTVSEFNRANTTSDKDNSDRFVNPHFANDLPYHLSEISGVETVAYYLSGGAAERVMKSSIEDYRPLRSDDRTMFGLSKTVTLEHEKSIFPIGLMQMLQHTCRDLRFLKPVVAAEKKELEISTANIEPYVKRICEMAAPVVVWNYITEKRRWLLYQPSLEHKYRAQNRSRRFSELNPKTPFILFPWDFIFHQPADESHFTERVTSTIADQSGIFSAGLAMLSSVKSLGDQEALVQMAARIFRAERVFVDKKEEPSDFEGLDRSLDLLQDSKTLWNDSKKLEASLLHATQLETTHVFGVGDSVVKLLGDKDLEAEWNGVKQKFSNRDYATFGPVCKVFMDAHDRIIGFRDLLDKIGGQKLKQGRNAVFAFRYLAKITDSTRLLKDDTSTNMFDCVAAVRHLNLAYALFVCLSYTVKRTIGAMFHIYEDINNDLWLMQVVQSWVARQCVQKHDEFALMHNLNCRYMSFTGPSTMEDGSPHPRYLLPTSATDKQRIDGLRLDNLAHAICWSEGEQVESADLRKIRLQFEFPEKSARKPRVLNSRKKVIAATITAHVRVAPQMEVTVRDFLPNLHSTDYAAGVAARWILFNPMVHHHVSLKPFQAPLDPLTIETYLPQFQQDDYAKAIANIGKPEKKKETAVVPMEVDDEDMEKKMLKQAEKMPPIALIDRSNDSMAFNHELARHAQWLFQLASFHSHADVAAGSAALKFWVKSSDDLLSPKVEQKNRRNVDLENVTSIVIWEIDNIRRNKIADTDPYYDTANNDSTDIWHRYWLGLAPTLFADPLEHAARQPFWNPIEFRTAYYAENRFPTNSDGEQNPKIEWMITPPLSMIAPSSTVTNADEANLIHMHPMALVDEIKSWSSSTHLCKVMKLLSNWTRDTGKHGLLELSPNDAQYWSTYVHLHVTATKGSDGQSKEITRAFVLPFGECDISLAIEIKVHQAPDSAPKNKYKIEARIPHTSPLVFVTRKYPPEHSPLNSANPSERYLKANLRLNRIQFFLDSIDDLAPRFHRLNLEIETRHDFPVLAALQTISEGLGTTESRLQGVRTDFQKEELKRVFDRYEEDPEITLALNNLGNPSPESRKLREALRKYTAAIEKGNNFVTLFASALLDVLRCIFSSNAFDSSVDDTIEGTKAPTRCYINSESTILACWTALFTSSFMAPNKSMFENARAIRSPFLEVVDDSKAHQRVVRFNVIGHGLHITLKAASRNLRKEQLQLAYGSTNSDIVQMKRERVLMQIFGPAKGQKKSKDWPRPGWRQTNLITYIDLEPTGKVPDPANKKKRKTAVSKEKPMVLEIVKHGVNGVTSPSEKSIFKNMFVGCSAIPREALPHMLKGRRDDSMLVDMIPNERERRVYNPRWGGKSPGTSLYQKFFGLLRENDYFDAVLYRPEADAKATSATDYLRSQFAPVYIRRFSNGPYDPKSSDSFDWATYRDKTIKPAIDAIAELLFDPEPDRKTKEWQIKADIVNNQFNLEKVKAFLAEGAKSKGKEEKRLWKRLTREKKLRCLERSLAFQNHSWNNGKPIANDPFRKADAKEESTAVLLIHQHSWTSFLHFIRAVKKLQTISQWQTMTQEDWEKRLMTYNDFAYRKLLGIGRRVLRAGSAMLYDWLPEPVLLSASMSRTDLVAITNKPRQEKPRHWTYEGARFANVVDSKDEKLIRPFEEVDQYWQGRWNVWLKSIREMHMSGAPANAKISPETMRIAVKVAIGEVGAESVLLLFGWRNMVRKRRLAGTPEMQDEERESLDSDIRIMEDILTQIPELAEANQQGPIEIVVTNSSSSSSSRRDAGLADMDLSDNENKRSGAAASSSSSSSSSSSRPLSTNTPPLAQPLQAALDAARRPPPRGSSSSSSSSSSSTGAAPMDTS